MRALTAPTLVLERDEGELRADELPLLAREPSLGARRQLLRGPRFAGDERGRQRAALPEIVVVDLGDRSAEAVLELRLRREDMAPLALQRAGLREVELGRQDRDVAAAQESAGAGAVGPASSSEVRSTSRVS
jgi:hypothetical protein